MPLTFVFRQHGGNPEMVIRYTEGLSLFSANKVNFSEYAFNTLFKQQVAQFFK